MDRFRRAFTLVELLVVIAIIAVLASLLMPALERARQSAWSVQCMNNVRQFMMAMAMYCQDEATVPPHNCYAEQGEVMPQLGVLKAGRYLTDYQVLVCPTSPTYLEFKWTSGNPYDRDDALFKNFWNYSGTTVYTGGGAMMGQNVPMGTYYYMAGSHGHTDVNAPFGTAAGYTLGSTKIRSAARYAAIWDWDMRRWGGLSTRPHAFNPGSTCGYFDAHVEFVPEGSVVGWDETTPYITQFYVYYYVPGTTPWPGYGLQKSCFDTNCFAAQIAAIRQIIWVP